MSMIDLNSGITLVTGAGQGVGRQVALDCASHGAGGVVVNDYFLDRAEAVVREIEDAGGKAIAVQGDVTNINDMKRVVSSGTEAFGSIDILVNNAGNSGATPSDDIDKPFWDTDPSVWNSYVGVNFFGVMNSVAAVVPGMIERKAGRIITIISEAGRVGEVGLEVYSGAKAGAAGFMRATARTLGRYGITANCVSIAVTQTPGVEEELNAMSPELRKRWLERYVIRRFGAPQDISNMVLFLASDSNSWITGQTYPVNGGFSFGL